MARSCVQIDFEAIVKNVQVVREAVGPKHLIMAIVKKDAYSHGLVRTSKRLIDAGVDRLGVANAKEAADLRDAGVSCPIHSLGPPLPGEMEACVNNDIIVTISDVEVARTADQAAAGTGKILKCHIIVDTGMGRLGPLPGDARSLAVETASMKNIELEGAFTHFSECDNGKRCAAQLESFLTVISEIRKDGIELPILHAAACGTIFYMPEAHLDMIRVGLCLYGVYNTCGMRDSVTLHPAMRVAARITFVKQVPAGTPISYGGTFVTKRPTVVATIPIGYGDGYDFRLSNRGWVGVSGKRAPILGCVTMDYIMVDVTDIPDVRPGTEAAILGSPGPGAEELAELVPTVPHEIICSLGGGGKD